jgi:hypothetical protein
MLLEGQDTRRIGKVPRVGNGRPAENGVRFRYRISWHRRLEAYEKIVRFM